MNRELALPCHYKVSLNPTRNSYHYSTNTGAEYEVLFSQDNEIFSSTDLKNVNVYMLVISKTQNGTGKKDPEIRETVSAIMDHLFVEKNRVLVYVYDGNDGRELTRKRLFNMWLSRYANKGQIVNKHASISAEEITYDAGIIFHTHNEQGAENSAITNPFILNAFALNSLGFYDEIILFSFMLNLISSNTGIL